jgi:hypothetical protein
MELAALAGLDPKYEASRCKSLPNRKLKLSMEEKRPEKMQTTRPRVKLEEAIADVATFISYSRLRPAMAKHERPTTTRAVPIIKV